MKVGALSGASHSAVRSLIQENPGHGKRCMMKSAVSAHPKEQMADLLATLRSYAKGVLLQGDLLTLSEAQDKSSRMN